VNKVIDINAVGFYISTPILYLISNLGDTNFHNLINETDHIESNAVCMRIQNSFTPLMPLICSNTEFVKSIPIGNITDFEVRLVDANLHDLKLLSPMLVTFSIQQDTSLFEQDATDFWQFTYVKPERSLPSRRSLVPLNPELMIAINSDPLAFN
jgi:hypothetical protein